LQENEVDLAIAGGGLSGALIAWRLSVERPELRLAVIERGERLGGNHTWSFHDTDLTKAALDWIEPLIIRRWPRQEVRFPAHRRMMSTGYASISSERLHDVIAPALGDGLIAGAGVASLDADAVHLDDQRTIRARAVLDARGQRGAEALTLGFQKFVGQLLRFEAPHGLDAPIIMDAGVPQTDGYRFIYVLPFTEDTALVEDTYYADRSVVDRAQIVEEIADYCAGAGWRIAEVVREEEGVLPIALAGDIDAHLDQAVDGVAQAGLGAGLFHPLTGYSLPDAVELAMRIAAAPDLSGPSLSALTREHARRVWNDRAFYRMLSRFLFYAARPEGRYRVLERFYRLPQPLIERFYASVSTRRDKLRVLVGKPPVSFARAVQCVHEDFWLEHFWRKRDTR